MQRIDPVAKALAALAIVLVLGAGLPSSLEAEVITAAGYLRKVAAKSATDATSTQATSYVNVEHGVVTFTSTVPGPVLITFCASTITTGGGTVFIRAKLDGITLGGYQDRIFLFDGNESTCGQWLEPGVPAGQHTVRIRWKVESSETAWLENRTLTVQYSK